MNKPIVVIGGGGHAAAVIDALLTAGHEIVGVLDSNLPTGYRVLGDVCVLGNDDMLGIKLKPNLLRVALGIGPQPKSYQVKKIVQNIRKLGFIFAPVCHASAVVSPYCDLSSTSQILAGAIIQPQVSIGDFSVVNTRASLDHGVKIGARVHVAPGVVVCGEVVIKDDAYIGAGSILFPRVQVGARSVVGAGSIVRSDVLADEVVYGVH